MDPSNINHSGGDEQQAIDELTTCINDWCDLGGHRAYILTAIARRKENQELTNSNEIVHRRIITSKEDIDPHLRDLLAIAGRHNYDFRVYLTVNARDTRKALFEFQKDLTDITEAFFYDDTDQIKKITHLDSEWKSILRQKRSAADGYFQFDLDGVTESQQKQFIKEVPTEVLHVVRTPNGYHVITEPFNYTDWEPPVEYDELDTDGQLFIHKETQSSKTDAKSGGT